MAGWKHHSTPAASASRSRSDWLTVAGPRRNSCQTRMTDTPPSRRLSRPPAQTNGTPTVTRALTIKGNSGKNAQALYVSSPVLGSAGTGTG